MKRIIALVLVLCMALGMVVSVSAVPASDFTRTLNLVRLIRAIFAKDDETSPAYGELEDGILTIYVDAKGKSGAKGTEKTPMASIEEARDAIRTLDKSDFDGIDVVIKSGTYKIEKTIEFTAEDAGTKNCPIRYIGEAGVTLSGGISFDYKEFEKANGDTLLLFPEEVRDMLYMYDMGKLGYTSADIAEMLEKQKYYNEIGLINVNGKQMDIARYPNADEGWIEIEGGHFLDKNGNYTEYTDNDNVAKELMAVQTIIEYGDEHMERVLSWKNVEDIFVRGRYKFVWCLDDTEVTSFYEDRDEVLLPYSGGYFPVEGGLLYFYNIPEELDAPGEYYVDRNAILYYYPEEDFETAQFTVSTIDDDMIRINGADWLTFENLTIETSLKNGISFTANNISVRNCKINDIYSNGIVGVGNNATIYGNEIINIGQCGVKLNGGDIETLTRSNNVICNNLIKNWATRGIMEHGIRSHGCGSTICHNELGESGDRAVDINGPLHLAEYNYIYDTCLFYCDEGTLRTTSICYGTVVRYNVVINTGYLTELDIVGVAAIISDGSGGNEFYGNIAYNSTGDSLLAAGIDRDVSFHHNLCIKPGREGYEANCPQYAQFYTGDWYARLSPDTMPDFMHSDIWLSTFPELIGVHDNYDPENPTDPTFYYAPVNTDCYNNYLFLDKAYNTYTKMYQHMKGTTEFIEEYVKWFNTGEELQGFSLTKGNLTTYTSLRNKNPITISEALAIANEAVGTVMTEEQLNEVGRIGVEYNIGDILVQ
ncbi:MAG: right-handed parallel beta-helix repeat-containing protein [Ruminococcaceae bacterium]|nr:right-handed parallel beta-helix repeat-containing protein [Oscillospiraceae bacterium]